MDHRVRRSSMLAFQHATGEVSRFTWVVKSVLRYRGIAATKRNIKGFMVQGGDPTGTGKGGQSIWGQKFGDEIRHSLKHDKRGIVSMANSGPNTNAAQFFITYAKHKHLDGKYTIFGKVLGGMEVLDKMEKSVSDSKLR
eukprot:1180571-Prorocentrum_minimum.AAC.4